MVLGDLAFLLRPPDIRDSGCADPRPNFSSVHPVRRNRFLLPNQSGGVRLRSRDTGSTSATELHWFSLVSKSGVVGVARKEGVLFYQMP